LRKYITAIILTAALSVNSIFAQDSLRFSGQFSSWLNISTKNELPLLAGGRYIPQLNLGHKTKKSSLFDSELSLNVYGTTSLHPFDSAVFAGKIKPYRGWIRYSTDQFELRLGLQKINFGSAMILRPLMWFDQIDPRDPLQLTDGVWALLGRYYFLNNSNIWIWGLYGNNKPRGWEHVPGNRRIPEFGGRIQLPVPGGEAAISFNHRVADNTGMTMFTRYFEKIPEDRIGFDARWDLKAGLWVEGSWTRKGKNLELFTNQEIINAGVDYTFKVGNGLYAAYEQLLASNDQKAFTFRNVAAFSLLSASYPVGLFDKLNGIVFYNWTDNNFYNFVSWQKQFDKIMFYIMGYWNPDTNLLPSMNSGSAGVFTGKGIQLMFVYNH
jgi:hypothetical protein